MKPTNIQFYLDRAAECRSAATASSLVNVRRKNAEAEASWRAMAELAVARGKGG